MEKINLILVTWLMIATLHLEGESTDERIQCSQETWVQVLALPPVHIWSKILHSDTSVPRVAGSHDLPSRTAVKTGEGRNTLGLKNPGISSCFCVFSISQVVSSKTDFPANWKPTDPFEKVLNKFS